jgi:hypothetical protein
MGKKMTRLLAVLLAVLVALPDRALAKGPPSMVSITGPGLDEPIEVTDPALLLPFSFYQFQALENRIDRPPDPGIGYLITRYIEDAGQMRAWDRVVYYPLAGGMGGYVFFEGLAIQNMWTEGQGKWFTVSLDGDVAMRLILAAHSLRSKISGADRWLATLADRLNQRLTVQASP